LRILFHFFLATLLAGIAFFPQTESCAQPTPPGECHFLGLTKSDIVGQTGPHPDDVLDAAFSLALRPRPSGTPISTIEIRAMGGPRGAWTSTANVRGSHFLGVARAKDPSLLLNHEGGLLNLNSQEEQNLLLYVTDDGTFADKNRKYQIRIVNEDRTSITIPVSSEPAAQPLGSVTESTTGPIRMSAVLKGISNYDAVSPGRTIVGDDKADGLFVLSVQAKDKVITGIEIRNTDGVASVWDTISTGSNPAIGVAFVKDPVRLINKRDSSVSIPVKDQVDLNLYVGDNGSIAGGKTHYRIAATFQDGEMAWCPVQTAQRSETSAPEPPPGATRVNFLGSWLGYMSTDAVGPYPGLKPDGKGDSVFGVDIEVSPKNYITGLEINSLVGTGRKWGTAGTSPDSWGLGVAYQSAPTALLNKPDGSIRIPVDKRVQFYLYAADPGELSRTHQNLRIIIHLADGSSYQQMVRRPSNATTSSVVPGVDETPAAKGVLTCEFRGFIVDLVNTSGRPSKDGYLDGTFITKLEVQDKKLAKVEISGGDGVVRWSTDPKPPVMFLGAALYPKIYKLINERPGPMSLPLSGKRTLYLYAADNGMLSDPKSRLTVTVHFTDKTKLSAEAIK
jgi:hypothetical protein